MPFNDKMEWVHPENSLLERDEHIGYTVCFCGKGIKLHQAGFDVELHMCSMCKEPVADKDEFFKNLTAVEVMSK